MNYPFDFTRTAYIFQAWQDEDYHVYHVKKSLKKIKPRQKFLRVKKSKKHVKLLPEYNTVKTYCK